MEPNPSISRPDSTQGAVEGMSGVVEVSESFSVWRGEQIQRTQGLLERSWPVHRWPMSCFMVFFVWGGGDGEGVSDRTGVTMCTSKHSRQEVFAFASRHGGFGRWEHLKAGATREERGRLVEASRNIGLGQNPQTLMDRDVNLPESRICCGCRSSSRSRK